MVTFSQVKPSQAPKDFPILYIFHFLNHSARGISIFYDMATTLSSSPSSGTDFEYCEITNPSATVNPGCAETCSFYANQLFMSGGPNGPNASSAPNAPPIVAINTPAIITAYAQFWSGASPGQLFGTLLDLIKCASDVVESAMDVEDGDVFGAVKQAINAGQNFSQAVQSAKKDGNQYLNLVIAQSNVSLQQSGGWYEASSDQNTSTLNSAYNENAGFKMTVTIDGGGNKLNTKDIYVQYYD